MAKHSKKKRNRRSRSSSSSSMDRSSSSSSSDSTAVTHHRERRKRTRHSSTDSEPSPRKKRQLESHSATKHSSRKDKKEKETLLKKRKKHRKRKEEKKKHKKKKKSSHEKLSKDKVELVSPPASCDTAGVELVGPAVTPEASAAVAAASALRRPMTREEWEKEQSIVRRVVDPLTGRERLIKGSGEVLEEIVSQRRHSEINKAATVHDGAYFATRMGIYKK